MKTNDFAESFDTPITKGNKKCVALYETKLPKSS